MSSELERQLLSNDWPKNPFTQQIEACRACEVEPDLYLKNYEMVWEEAVFSTLQHVLGMQAQNDNTMCHELALIHGEPGEWKFEFKEEN